MISRSLPCPAMGGPDEAAIAFPIALQSIAVGTYCMAAPARLLSVQANQPCDCTVYDDTGRPIAGFTNSKGRIFDLYSEDRLFLVFNKPVTITYE